MAEWLNSLRLRVRAFLRRRRMEQDLQDELAFHLAMREEQLGASGARDAGAGARRRFGNVTRIREDLRESWALAPRLGAFVRDFRYAARTLPRSPGFAAVVVLTLGLGIGANTAFFSVVNAVLIRPLGYAGADRLLLLYEGFPQRIDRLPFPRSISTISGGGSSPSRPLPRTGTSRSRSRVTAVRNGSRGPGSRRTCFAHWVSNRRAAARSRQTRTGPA